ncbi:MAG TPA: hypothetical protein VFL76_05515 [Edaphocola sp.]|nr:hypothetical protein [Edaphocola sp.]
MTEKALISSWLDQPTFIKQETAGRLHDLCVRFPLFVPLHYLKALRANSYESASLNNLYKLFPVNRVLIHQLFTNCERGRQRAEEPLFPDETLRAAASGQDYFAQQGVEVNTDLPDRKTTAEVLSTEKDLMVVMSFSEWLRYLERRSQKAKEEEAGKSALRALWQKQKLTAAIEEEEEEIPENVFEMAVNSITAKEELISESMAAVYALQGKKEKAMDMYKKLSLQNPEKSAYFAKKIEILQKDLDI